MGCLMLMLLLAVEYFIAAFLFWIVTLCLGAFGVTLAFSWGGAFAFWVLFIVLRLMLGSSRKSD